MQDSTAQTQDSIVQVRGLKNAAYLKYTPPPLTSNPLSRIIQPHQVQRLHRQGAELTRHAASAAAG